MLLRRGHSTFPGPITISDLTASELLATNASKVLVSLAVATYPSLAELAYVKGVTSDIQTQLGNKQPLDATLTSIALLGTAADKILYSTAADTWAEAALTAFARSILDDANEATFKATVNLEADVDFEAYGNVATHAALLTGIHGITIASTLQTIGAYAIILRASDATDITLPTTGTLVTLAGTEELDNKTLDSSVLKGTLTASGTVTLPAVTLGGTVTISAQSFDAGAGQVVINTTGGNMGLKVSGSHVAVGPALTLTHEHTTPDVGNDLAGVYYEGYDGATPAVKQNLCTVSVKYTNVTDTTEAVRMVWNLWDAGIGNEAMILTGDGQVSGDLAYAEFDEYDDVLVLRNGLRDVVHSLVSNPALEQMGVVTRKNTGSGWMLNFQPMMYLTVGGLIQTRQALEDTREELLDKLANIEARLAKAGLN